MAKPGTVPPVFASASTFTASSGLPAGAEALEGTSVRLSPPSNFWLYGLVPGNPLYAQWMDYLLGLETEWTRWVAEGTSTMTKTAHPVETDSAGIARLWGLRLGDGSATGLNATEKLTVIGDGTQRAVDIDVPASGLEGIAITSDSDVAPALTIASTGTQGAAFLDASGSLNPTLEVLSTTQSAISATSIDAPAIVAEAAGSLTECAIKGTGDVCGVIGVAVGGGGTGVSGTTASGAALTAEGIRGIGLGDGLGGRFSAVDGNAVECSVSGGGAPLRCLPATEPVVAQLGQIWPFEYDTGLVHWRYTHHDGGLGPATYWFFGGQYPFISESAYDVTATVAGATNQLIVAVTVDNPHSSTVPVLVSGEFTFQPNPIGTTPQASALVVTLHDETIGTTFETDNADALSTTLRHRFSIRGRYNLPTGSTEIRLRVGVPSGTGSFDITKSSLEVRTADVVS